MSLEEALQAHLAAYSGLSALVGPRVYPVQLPQTPVLPAVTFQRISTAPTQHRGGAEAALARFQIDGWATTFGGAVALREQIRAAMATFRRAADPRVDVALLQDDRDMLDPATNRRRASMDYMIFAEQS